MLVGFTSLALVLLAIHTKRIYTNAMEEMLSERTLPPRPGQRAAPGDSSHPRP